MEWWRGKAYQLIRHEAPRKALFTPIRTKYEMPRAAYTGKRTTIGTYENGDRFVNHLPWLVGAEPHKKEHHILPKKWCGTTHLALSKKGIVMAKNELAAAVCAVSDCHRKATTACKHRCSLN